MKSYKEFLVLTKQDIRILIIHSQKGTEFSRLDMEDREIFIWYLLYETPKRLESWIEFLVKDYPLRKRMRLDYFKLINEVREMPVSVWKSKNGFLLYENI